MHFRKFFIAAVKTVREKRNANRKAVIDEPVAAVGRFGRRRICY
jgi:hypothetical protein